MYTAFENDDSNIHQRSLPACRVDFPSNRDNFSVRSHSNSRLLWTVSLVSVLAHITIDDSSGKSEDLNS